MLDDYCCGAYFSNAYRFSLFLGLSPHAQGKMVYRKTSVWEQGIKHIRIMGISSEKPEHVKIKSSKKERKIKILESLLIIVVISEDSHKNKNCPSAVQSDFQEFLSSLHDLQ